MKEKKISIFSVELGPDFLIPLKSKTHQEAIEECKKYYLPADKIIKAPKEIY